MGVFTRFKDIVSSNINSMLDKAEDPEKMIRLMIQEMEETLVEIKASCASFMADKKRIGRQMEEVNDRVRVWEERAKLAVDKGKEDLAREALLEKNRFLRQAEGLQEKQMHFDALIDQAQDDIDQLESKLEAAKNKQRLLVQRHIRARTKKSAQEDIRRASGVDTMIRFDQFEQRIERMEAEADLVNTRSSRNTLEKEFELLENEQSIEQELQELKGGAKKAEQNKKEK